MKYSDFEKQIGDKLRNEEIQLDTAAFYKSLTAQKKKKKRGAIIIVLPFLFAAAFIAVFSLGYSNENPNVINEAMSSSIESENNKNTTELSKETIENTKQTNNEAEEIVSSEEDINATTESKNIQHSTSNTSDQTNAINQGKINESSTKVTENTSAKNTNQVAIKNTNFYVNSQSLHSNGTDIIKSIEVSENKNLGTNKLNEEIKYDKGIVVDESNAQNDNSNLHVTKINSLLSGLSFEAEKISILTKIECPDFRVDKKIFDVEILGEVGYFRPIKDFDPNTVNTNEVYELRNENEASREGYHAGIYAKLIGNRIPIYIQAGLSQDFLTERMSIEYSYIERDTTQGIISITESENGDTITAIIGDIIKETEVSGNKIKHYRLQMIDIPVVAGYQFGFNRLSVGLEGGVLFNIRMRSNGSILAAKTNFEDVEIQNPFKSKIGMSYVGGISLGYHLSPRSKIYLNTKMRFIPDAVNMGGNTLTQKYKFLGLNVGYGYLF